MSNKINLKVIGVGFLSAILFLSMSCTRIRQKVSASPSPTPNSSSMTLISVTPNYGPPAGGTTIHLAGSGFVQGITAMVGGNACTSLTFVSSSNLTCVIPPGTIGLTQVVVTNPDGGTASLSFTYGLPSMSITSGGNLSISTNGKYRMVGIVRQVSRVPLSLQAAQGIRPKNAANKDILVPGLKAFINQY